MKIFKFSNTDCRTWFMIDKTRLSTLKLTRKTISVF